MSNRLIIIRHAKTYQNSSTCYLHIAIDHTKVIIPKKKKKLNLQQEARLLIRSWPQIIIPNDKF